LFDKSSPEFLLVRLYYAPTDRGERLSLDAWTGAVQTELLPVPLDKLKFD
jgi:hypothetical protein